MFPVEDGLTLVLVRGAADAALLSQFGALLALAWLAPPVLARPGWDAPAVAKRLAWVAGLSIIAALLLSAGWLAVQSATLAGSMADAPLVLQETLFGRLVLARLGLLCLTGLALARHRLWLATALAGAAVASQAGHAHAWAMHEGPSWLLLSGAVHLLAAAAWLGGLAPLLLLVAAAPPEVAVLAAVRFAPLGTISVLLLAGTALFQAYVLVGTLPGLVGTGYGLVALAKLAGFLGLLSLAARNRFRLAPALSGGTPKAAKRRLARSIAAETVTGLLVVLAASLLTSLPPAMHEQPLWLFPWRLSLDAVREDASLLQEAALAATVLATAAVMVAAAFLLRLRARWLIAQAGAVAAFLAMPHLDLLLAGAYPTQYWRLPTGFASASIANGAALYPVHCAGCHGVKGHGDGPAASGLPVPPVDLTVEHLWAHEDGELFWWLSHGIAAPDGSVAMPGFADALTEDQRWALIDWVRANNAGAAFAAAGAWPRPVQAPNLEASCPDGRLVTLEALRGQVVRIVFGPARTMPGVVTIRVTSSSPVQPSMEICAAGEDAVLGAYTVLTGRPPDGLAGAQLLIDGGGWLRALQRPGAAPGWDDPSTLADAVRDIEAHPLAESPRSHAGMRM